jgi:hypothetical protein
MASVAVELEQDHGQLRVGEPHGRFYRPGGAELTYGSLYCMLDHEEAHRALVGLAWSGAAGINPDNTDDPRAKDDPDDVRIAKQIEELAEELYSRVKVKVDALRVNLAAENARYEAHAAAHAAPFLEAPRRNRAPF